MNDDLIFKKTCKVLLSLLFILLISRIDKSPLDMPSDSGTAHTTSEVSYLEKSAHTFDTSLFLIPLYLDPFTTQSVKHAQTIASAYQHHNNKDNSATIFCKYIFHNRSNQVLTKVLLI